jgi:hypothetical protein
MREIQERFGGLKIARSMALVDRHVDEQGETVKVVGSETLVRGYFP